jgi:hypothetical protein
MRTVYVETSIFSYLAARPSRDLLAAARQQLTERWWHDHRHRFELFVSPVVEMEAGKGDPEAARRRLSAMAGIPALAVTDAVEQLAGRLIKDGAVPATAIDDAVHVALAAVHRMDYLLTWNCRHIANAEKKSAIRETCIAQGHPYPEICTPEELMGESSDEG